MKMIAILILIVNSVCFAGTIVPWGDCETGQCGIIDNNNPPDFGLPFPEGNDFIDIALSIYCSFAVRESGEIVGWGRFGSEGLLENIPTGNFIAVDAGDLHAIALTNEGYLMAWGSNSYGQRDVSTEPNWLK